MSEESCDTALLTFNCTDTSLMSSPLELKIASTGGALEHAPNRLGNFNVAGALWENTVPFFE